MKKSERDREMPAKLFTVEDVNSVLRIAVEAGMIDSMQSAQVAGLFIASAMTN